MATKELAKLHQELQIEADRLHELEMTLLELQEKENFLPTQIDQFKKDALLQQSKIISSKKLLQDNKDEKLKQKQILLNQLNLYHQRLGLHFQTGRDGETRLSFSQLDRKNPNREFYFTFTVDKNDYFQFKEAEPALRKEDIDEIIRRVNATKNFSAFVSSVRKLFSSAITHST